MDRVKEGMRAARRQKRKAKDKQASSENGWQSIRRYFKRRKESFKKKKSTKRKLGGPKSFFSRFVEGYLQAEPYTTKQERVGEAIKDFFGRQSLRRS